jgi:hypothetical protein
MAGKITDLPELPPSKTLQNILSKAIMINMDKPTFKLPFQNAAAKPTKVELEMNSKMPSIIVY